MGKGDKKSKRGKIVTGSYGKKRPRKATSVDKIPVKVLDEDSKKTAKEKVKKEVGIPTEKTANATIDKKPKTVAKPKEKEEKTAEVKPKVAKAKVEKKDDTEDTSTKSAKTKKTED